MLRQQYNQKAMLPSVQESAAKTRTTRASVYQLILVGSILGATLTYYFSDLITPQLSKMMTNNTTTKEHIVTTDVLPTDQPTVAPTMPPTENPTRSPTVSPTSMPKYAQNSSIPFTFQGPTKLSKEILSSSSTGDLRFFSADGHGHGHRDCRFSSPHPTPSWPHIKAYMVNLFQAWTRFTSENQIQYWIVHGTLLGWHWNQTIMDFDDDIDVAMTLHTMHELLQPLNGTVFEGQYLVELNSFYAKRKRQNINAIDAEFIDILGGFKIDITAFSTSSSRNSDAIRASDGHTYKLDDIFPLQPSHLDGAPTFVPKEAQRLLVNEYKEKSLTNNVFRDFRFNGSRWIKDKPGPMKENSCRGLQPGELYANASTFFIPWEQRKNLSLQTSVDDEELNAQIASQLEQVDVDNTIASGQSELKDRKLHVAEFNIERGTHWCEAAKLILADALVRDVDVIFVNEADWGMSRSDNAHTGRLLAQELGMNYAWGIEFLELTPGNGRETRQANEATDCPKNRRGIGWPGHKLDALGYTGNAILSKWPLTNVRILRLPGINRLFHSKPGQKITAGGTEKRLGSRMVLYATIETVPGYDKPIHLGCFHLQMMWDNRYPAEWEALGKKTMSLMRHEQNEVVDATLGEPFLIGGDGWKPKWCEEEVGFTNLHSYQKGDWICGRNVNEVSDFKKVTAKGIADHDLFFLTVKLP